MKNPFQMILDFAERFMSKMGKPLSNAIMATRGRDRRDVSREEGDWLVLNEEYAAWNISWIIFHPIKFWHHLIVMNRELFIAIGGISLVAAAYLLGFINMDEAMGAAIIGFAAYLLWAIFHK